MAKGRARNAERRGKEVEVMGLRIEQSAPGKFYLIEGDMVWCHTVWRWSDLLGPGMSAEVLHECYCPFEEDFSRGHIAGYEELREVLYMVRDEEDLR
jgi:hypothetical protein